MMQTISHYRLLERLGGSYMGVVHKAEDIRDGQTVALKFLPFELTEDPETRRRFIRDAKAASALDHPNICTVHEIDEAEDGRLFIAMAYYDGETLKKRFADSPLDLDLVVDLTRQIAIGLAAAHEQGIVHRDLKPANVLVTSHGLIKILDFGLAKMISFGGLTQTGWSLGTLAYMAPEQTRGEEATTASDLWALGTMMYEATTGDRPFDRAHLPATIQAIHEEEPEPLTALRPEAPFGLQAVISRLLAKDPEERYPSCHELLSDLDAVSDPDLFPEAEPTETVSRSSLLDLVAQKPLPQVSPPKPSPEDDETAEMPRPVMTERRLSRGLPWPWLIAALVAGLVLLLVFVL